jgi:hypothetical protein
MGLPDITLRGKWAEGRPPRAGFGLILRPGTYLAAPNRVRLVHGKRLGGHYTAADAAGQQPMLSHQ